MSNHSHPAPGGDARSPGGGVSGNQTAREVPVEVLPPAPGPGTGGRGAPGPEANPAPPSGPSPFFSHTARFVLSLALAGVADAAQAFFPPDWVFVDVVAVAGFLLIWGFRWEIAAVLLPELIPGMSVFPTWSVLALYLGQKYGGASKK